MLQAVGEIDVKEFSVAAPAFLTLLAIPLLFSIADGIGLGLITAAMIGFLPGQKTRLSGFGYALAAVFLLKFLSIFPFAK
jgi:AGZA family xanthine/uracil permease-like MFS transporter